MSVIVHLSETAFMSIVVSAIESFPSKYIGKRKPKNTFPEGEIFGLLFGQRFNKNSSSVFNVSIATPMQVLENKTSDEVWRSPRHFERIKTVIEAYPMFQLLGCFHSHPWSKDEYKGIKSSKNSLTDELSALADADECGDDLLEVILGLTFLQKAMNTPPDIRWSHIQNYCGNYKYSITAYITNTDKRKLELVDNLICPLAAGVGNYDLL
ncbi:MAG: hypothetical protein SWO11_08395 [Thermodesulfobacteriota bacterium]|nr:hypothetical protein [Thermodesulfobacteriota bacterium]